MRCPQCATINTLTDTTGTQSVAWVLAYAASIIAPATCGHSE